MFDVLFTGFAEINPLAKLGAEIFFFAAPMLGALALVRSAIDKAGPVGSVMTGGLNKLSQGISQSQKKYRAGKRQKDFGKFKAGQRGGALTKRVGEGVGTFLESENKGALAASYLQGERGRRLRQRALADQRKINQMRYGKLERTQAGQEDDNKQRALTYANEEEARAGLAQEYGMSQRDIETAIAGVRADGGFSADKAMAAVKQLAATGTGYDNIDQLHSAVARVSGGNRDLASDMLGEVNAVTKKVGRFDLAAGYGEHMRIYDAIQERGGSQAADRQRRIAMESARQAAAAAGADEAGQEQAAYAAANDVRIMTNGERQSAHMEALRGTSAMDLARAKVATTNELMPSLRQGLIDAQERAMTAGTALERQDATEEAARISGMIESIAQNYTYAAPAAAQRANELVVAPTSGTIPGTTAPGPAVGNRQTATVNAIPVQQQRNPVTGKMDTVYMTDPVTGDVLTDRMGAPIPEVNPNYNPGAGQAYGAQVPRNPLDPRDPRFGS